MLEGMSAIADKHPLPLAGYDVKMDTLSDRIAKIINDTGLTLQELGEIAGVSAQAVYQWRDGTVKNIRNAPLFRIQRRLGYSAEWIGTGEGPAKIISVDDPTDILDLSGLTPSQKAALRATVDAFQKSGIAPKNGTDG